MEESKWAWHVARTAEVRNLFKILVVNPKGRDNLVNLG
jgi:hypothetical protein